MSAFGKLFGDPSVSTGEKIWAVLNNMIPVFGIFFLGWEAGPVLLLLWLDGWLGMWEIAAVAAVDVSREDPISARLKGLKKVFTWVFAFLFVGGLLSIPSVMAWAAIGSMTRSQYDHGLFSVLASGKAVLWAIGANVLLRAAQAVLSFRRRSGEQMTFTLEEKFHFLIFKAMGMLVLAQWLIGVGQTGLAVYVLLISGFFAWMELNPGRFLHLINARQGAKGGEKHISRKQKKRRGPDGPARSPEDKGAGPDPEP